MKSLHACLYPLLILLSLGFSVAVQGHSQHDATDFGIRGVGGSPDFFDPVQRPRGVTFKKHLILSPGSFGDPDFGLDLQQPVRMDSSRPVFQFQHPFNFSRMGQSNMHASRIR